MSFFTSLRRHVARYRDARRETEFDANQDFNFKLRRPGIVAHSFYRAEMSGRSSRVMNHCQGSRTRDIQGPLIFRTRIYEMLHSPPLANAGIRAWKDVPPPPDPQTRRIMRGLRSVTVEMEFATFGLSMDAILKRSSNPICKRKRSPDASNAILYRRSKSTDVTEDATRFEIVRSVREEITRT